ncbi:MAG: hypothetical protein QME25_05495 [Bacteroidota bacterium]|nr:hypothetical protein [Bacteroidota bacterium]
MLFALIFVFSPWAIAGVAAFKLPYTKSLIVGTALMLWIEYECYHTAFVVPSSSTSSLIYVVKPIIQLGGLVISVGIGYAVTRLLERKKYLTLRSSVTDCSTKSAEL